LGLAAGVLETVGQAFAAGRVPDAGFRPVFPEQVFQYDIFRFALFGLILILAAAPRPPQIGSRVFRVIPAALAAVFLLISANAWRSFEVRELSGLGEAIDALPQNSSVLGLDYMRESEYIKGFPFLQTFAYAQVVKGADLNFSFAEHGSGLANYSGSRKSTWSPGLEWSPHRVRPDDFLQFEFTLVNGDEKIHGFAKQVPSLVPVTGTGRWRLYRRR